MLPAKVPLAWSNLTHNKVKLAGSLAGITFAVALMFVEQGFMNALLDGVTGLSEAFHADLILRNPASNTIDSKEPFSRRHLYEVCQYPEVEAAWPIYIESSLSTWRNKQGVLRPIRVIAFHPGDDVFEPLSFRGLADALRAPDTAAYDANARGVNYGPPGVGDHAELAGRLVRIVGEFALGADFVNDGNLLMSDRNFLNYFPDRRLAEPDLLLVDVGLIKLRPDAANRAEEIRDRMNRDLFGGPGGDRDGPPDPSAVDPMNQDPPGRTLRGHQGEPDDAARTDVKVFTKAQFIEQERTFYRDHTPVGRVFNLGLVMGFVVGTIICYQILFSGIASYLREYATLLAIGHDRGYLVRVVLMQAFYLAVMGFTVGLAIAVGVYTWVAGQTRMPFVLGAGRILFIFAMTMAMCLVSAVIAIRKLWGAAPADLF